MVFAPNKSGTTPDPEIFRKEVTMYVSRLTFHTLPGKTHEVEQRLMTLLDWVKNAGGLRPRVMRTHYGSLGAADLVFEQEVEDPGTLEVQIHRVTGNKDFQQWAQEISGL
jgi:hypothetical protein